MNESATNGRPGTLGPDAYPADPEHRAPTYSGIFPRIEPGSPGPRAREPEPPRRPRRWLPLFLFLATCLSTFLVGSYLDPDSPVRSGVTYACSLMVILLAHEFGHYVQARRYGVRASLPHFIPLPLPPFGTIGAVIFMRPQTAGARALFDLAITGPIAGLVPALAFSFLGLRLSQVIPMGDQPFESLGSPLIFDLLGFLALGAAPENHGVLLHPMAYAGWVGIFITALNLIPIGQLDGGHILYALTPRAARTISLALLSAATLGAILGTVLARQYYWWFLMIGLLWLVGVRHPPIADHQPLGWKRIALGWTTLLFVVIGFTPNPLGL